MSRLIAMSSRRLFVQCSMSTALLVLAACFGGTGQSIDSSPTPAPAPTPTPPSGPPGPPQTGSFIWAIPFTVSGLTGGASLSVVLNGIYARVITNDSPIGGADFFVPHIPVGYLGLPNGSNYSITVGSQPPGETCTVSNGTGTLVNSPGPSAALISCVPTPPPAGPPPVFSTTAGAFVRAAVTGQAPAARQGATSFADPYGNFWLFGGSERSASGATGHFNDLWKFSSDLGGWSRVFGSDSLDSAGRYGTRGVSSPTNAPGARDSAMSWTDASGDLWMFGGQGRDVAGTAGALSDLWKFSIATRQWTWVSGADVVNSRGMYGVQNAPSTANRPGARSNGTSWIDSAGTLWLFGGYGIDSTGSAGTLDDLWQFTPATGTWTWLSGSVTAAAGSAQ
jgi:Galactose oxidase, central domain